MPPQPLLFPLFTSGGAGYGLCYKISRHKMVCNGRGQARRIQITFEDECAGAVDVACSLVVIRVATGDEKCGATVNINCRSHIQLCVGSQLQRAVVDSRTACIIVGDAERKIPTIRTVTVSSYDQAAGAADHAAYRSSAKLDQSALR